MRRFAGGTLAAEAEADMMQKKREGLRSVHRTEHTPHQQQASIVGSAMRLSHRANLACPNAGLCAAALQEGVWTNLPHCKSVVGGFPVAGWDSDCFLGKWLSRLSCRVRQSCTSPGLFKSLGSQHNVSRRARQGSQPGTRTTEGEVSAAVLRARGVEPMPVPRCPGPKASESGPSVPVSRRPLGAAACQRGH
jgi:hypothetical protein